MTQSLHTTNSQPALLAPPTVNPATESSPAPVATPCASLSALCAIARFHQIAADPATLAHQLGLSSSAAVTTQDLLRAAQHLGLKAKLSRSTPDRLALTPLPALVLMKPQPGAAPSDGPRVCILAQCDGERVLLQDPCCAEPRPTIESMDVFASQWSGELILITSRASLAGSLAKFDFSWFIPAIVKYRKLLGEVLLISFMLQLFGLVIVVIFESVLNALRAYVFSHTTNRIERATP